jgi:hypothetical protein
MTERFYYNPVIIPRRIHLMYSSQYINENRMQTVFQKEIYDGIPNVTVWQVLRKPLHLKAYKLSVVQGV